MLELPFSDQHIKVLGTRRNNTEYIMCCECITETDKIAGKQNINLQLDLLSYLRSI